jgi:hypothetical protein
VADSTVHALADGVAVADTDEFYAARSPFGAGNDVKLTGLEIAAKAPVQTVFGRTGTVTAAFTDITGVATNAQGGVGKVTLTQPATGSTLTIVDGKIATFNNTLTFAGTDGQTMTFPATSATLARTDAANTFTGNQTLGATAQFAWSGRAVLTSTTTAKLQFGSSDAAAPVAQTIQAQSVVAGNTNVAGATFTIGGSKSNGSGGGDVLLQTTLSTAASGTQNVLATAMTFQGGTQDCIAANFLGSAGFVRVSTQFDKTTDTALANVTGLSVTLTAGATYQFRAVLFITADAVGGQKYAMAGTCTATAIIYEVFTVSNPTNAIVISSKQTALAGSVGQAGSTDDFTTIEGLITVNAAGTLTVQFAQNASNGTSSVLVGSHMLVHKVA